MMGQSKNWKLSTSAEATEVDVSKSEQEAVDLVAALKKNGFDLNARIALKVIADMHQIAKMRRLKALQEATS